MTREEAIEVYNGLINEKIKEAFEFFAPELRESEDERIRKAIIELLKEVEEDETYTGRQHIPDMLSYLEKQKERGPLTKEEEYTLQRIIEYLEDETCPPEWISLLHDIYCLPYEKQKEQKPNYCHHEVDETGWAEEYRKAYYDGWNNCNMQHEQLKADHKPAEWSEEDEKIMQTMIKEGDLKPSEIAWLKSLRPSWKPSEEQMDALERASTNKYLSAKQFDILVSLYEQLKKL